MGRRNRTPEETARREKIRALLQDEEIHSMEDIQNLFKETIAEFMGNGLEAELDDELGYSKYDYKSKDTDSSRNGYSSKRLRTSFGDVDVSKKRYTSPSASTLTAKRMCSACGWARMKAQNTGQLFSIFSISVLTTVKIWCIIKMQKLSTYKGGNFVRYRIKGV